MARPLRIEYEGAGYHIISRGNRAEYMEAKNNGKFRLWILVFGINNESRG